MEGKEERITSLLYICKIKKFIPPTLIIYHLGCRGNENRFLSLEDCVSTCGGNTPDLDVDCTGVKCDSSQILFNQAKVGAVEPLNNL